MNKMNRNILLIIVAVLLLAGGAYMYQQSQTGTVNNIYQQGSVTPATSLTGSPTGTSEKMASSITVAIAEQNDSGESGTAVLTDQGNGKVKVEIMMSGFTQAVSQPAHIHVGACPDVGAVKYPLTNVVNGKSTTVVDATLAKLKSELPLGINVHKSAQEASVYTACGDLKF